MQVNAALHDDQPEAGAGNVPNVTAAMKRLEQSLLIVLRNAASPVNDAENRVIPRF